VFGAELSTQYRDCGTARFGRRTRPAIRPSALTSANVSIGDLNGDGRLDLLLAKGRHWPLVDRFVVGHVEAPSTIYFNGRSGRHYSPVQFGDNKGTVYGFAIADLDQDGRLDIAVARSDAPNIVYFSDSRPASGP
jgi:hypothetical protein